MVKNNIKILQDKIDKVKNRMDKISEKRAFCYFNRGTASTKEEFIKNDELYSELTLKLIKLTNEQVNNIDSYIASHIVGGFKRQYEYHDKSDLQTNVKTRINQWKQLQLGKFNDFFNKVEKDLEYSEFISNISCKKETICELKFNDEK